MNPVETNHVKILFQFYSELLEQDITETIWASPVNESLDQYCVLSIPFYIPALSKGDIITALYDDDAGILTYKEMIQTSGNSTAWIVITDDGTDIETVMEAVNEIGCESQALSDRYFTLNVKAATHYLQGKGPTEYPTYTGFDRLCGSCWYRKIISINLTGDGIPVLLLALLPMHWQN